MAVIKINESKNFKESLKESTYNYTYTWDNNLEPVDDYEKELQARSGQKCKIVKDNGNGNYEIEFEDGSQYDALDIELEEVSRVSNDDFFRINEGVTDIKLSDYFNFNIEQSGVYESDEFPAFPDGSPALVYDSEEWQVSAGASWDDDNVIEIAAMTYDAIDSGDVIEGENLISKTFSVNDKDAAVKYFNKLLSNR